jgi:hypothetical protein
MIDWDGPWGGGVTIHGSYLDAEPCGTSEHWNDSGNGDVS